MSSSKDLPLEIALSIFNTALPNSEPWDRSNVRQLVAMRQVSKNWATIIEKFPWKGFRTAWQLPQAVKSFPCLVYVQIEIGADQRLDLSPLSGCSQLLTVKIARYRNPLARRVWVALSSLPVTVKTLVLDSVLIEEYFLEKEDDAASTGLSAQSRPSDSADLPGKLPIVEEHLISGIYHSENAAQTTSSFMGRLTALASLELQEMDFDRPFPTADIPSALRELRLISIGCSEEWISNLLNHLPQLTRLHMDCLRPASFPEDFPEEENWRSTHSEDGEDSVIEDYYSQDFPGYDYFEGWDHGKYERVPLPVRVLLPLQSLREISLDFHRNEYAYTLLLPEEGQWLACLPALTKLELTEIKTAAPLECLRSLPLQHIRLSTCNPIDLNLFVPGALTALTSICITTSDRSWNLPGHGYNDDDDEGDDSIEGEDFFDVAANMLTLPKLQKFKLKGPFGTALKFRRAPEA